MSADRDKATAEAIDEIRSVSQELARLSGAVQSHGRAAEALAAASQQVEKLCGLLQVLPMDLSTCLDRGNQLLLSTEEALAPAGRLVRGLEDVQRSVASTATSDQLLGGIERLVGETRASGDDAVARTDKAIQGGVHGLEQAVRNACELLTKRIVAVDEELGRLSARVNAVESGVATASQAISDLNGRLEKQLLQVGERDARIQEKLSTLERLARRSLFAILMGREASPERNRGG